MDKNLNDIQEGDRITAMGAKVFTETLVVTEVTRYKGAVVSVILAGGRFWPMQPGRAAQTIVTVAS